MSNEDIQALREKYQTLPSNHILNIDIDAVAVIVKKTGKGEEVNVIIRTRGKDGEYKPLESDAKNRFRAITPPFLVGGGSYGPAEGNLGKTNEDGSYSVPRSAAKLLLKARVGNFDDGNDRDNLEYLQQVCMDHVEAISKHVMEQLFWKQTTMFKHITDNAISVVLNQLQYALFSEDHYGKRFAKYKGKISSAEDLRQLMFKDKEIEKVVMEKACEYFVEKARRLPGAPFTHQNTEHPKCICLTKKVWSHKAWNEGLKGDQETGPSETALPSTIENWDKILEAMTKMGRVFNSLKYAHSKNARAWKHPNIQKKLKVIDATTGKERMVTKAIPDPFWNPLFRDPKGKRLESLVAMSFGFRIYSGPSSSLTTYGLQTPINGTVSVIARSYATQEVVQTDYGYEADGFEILGAVPTDTSQDEEAKVAKEKAKAEAKEEAKLEPESTTVDEPDTMAENEAEQPSETPKKRKNEAAGGNKRKSRRTKAAFDDNDDESDF